MIVVDASALLEFLLQTPLGTRVEARLFRDRDEFHSPHLADVEVTQALRRLVRSGEHFDGVKIVFGFVGQETVPKSAASCASAA